MPLTLNSNSASLTVGAEKGAEIYGGASYTSMASAGGTFLGLPDTPSSYAGQAGRFVRVNASASALEFFDLFGSANTWSANQTISGASKLIFRDSSKYIASETTSTLDLRVGAGESFRFFEDVTQFISMNAGGMTLVNGYTVSGTNLSITGSFGTLNLSADSDVRINSHARFSSASEARFRSTSQRIFSSASGYLDLDSASFINLSIGALLQLQIASGSLTGSGNFEYSSLGITSISGFGGIVLRQSTTIGSGLAGVDYSLTFDGETNDGLVTWIEDDDYFLLSDDMMMNVSERIYFRDTGKSMHSPSSSELKIDNVQTEGDAPAVTSILSKAGPFSELGATSTMTIFSEGTRLTGSTLRLKASGALSSTEIYMADNALIRLECGGSDWEFTNTTFTMYSNNIATYMKLTSKSSSEIVIETGGTSNPDLLIKPRGISGVEFLFRSASTTLGRFGYNSSSNMTMTIDNFGAGTMTLNIDAETFNVSRAGTTANLGTGSSSVVNIGSSSSSVGVFGVTAVTRQSATTDIKVALKNYGWLQGSSASPLNLDGGKLTAGDGEFTGNVSVAGILRDGTGQNALELVDTGSSNYFRLYNAATSGNVSLRAHGGDTNVSMELRSRGSGDIIAADGSGSVIFRAIATSSGTNGVSVAQAVSGANPSISSIGSDSTVGLTITAKGGGVVECLQSTLNNPIFKITSQATNDDPEEIVYQGRVETTSSTSTNIISFSAPSATSFAVEAIVTARRTGGSAGSAEDGAAYRIMGLFKNVSGTATQIGSTAVLFSAESQALWDCAFSTSGSNVRVLVTGASNNNITWHATVRVWKVST